MLNLWDVLPTELQEAILSKSVELCRQEYIEAGRAKHARNKKKQERSALSADMIRHFMTGTDPIEIINWAFPVELRELEQLVDPPIEILDQVYDYDYTPYFDEWLQRCIRYMEDPEHANEWIVPSSDHWLVMFTRLVQFKQKHGHAEPMGESPALHLWLEIQRDPDTRLSREKRYSLRTLGVRLPRARP